MKHLLTTCIFLFFSKLIHSQSNSFIDSLKKNNNEIFIYEEICTGCIVINPPCSEYQDTGIKSNQFVFWKNKKGFFVTKMNLCGHTKIIKLKNKNIFEFIYENNSELDTNTLKYPVSSINNDSTLNEIKLSHFITIKIYPINILKFNKIEFKDYIFNSFNPPRAKDKNQYISQMNLKRNMHNKQTKIAELYQKITAILEEIEIKSDKNYTKIKTDL